MTHKLIEQRSRDLQARTRRMLLQSMVGPLAAAFFYFMATKQFRIQSGSLQPFFALAFAWSLAGLYFLNRGIWPAHAPADAGIRTGLQFCRDELSRQYELIRRSLLWSFGPILLSIATFIAGLALVASGNRALVPNGLPFLSLVVIWIVAYFVLRVREQRGLRREIAELESEDASEVR